MIVTSGSCLLRAESGMDRETTIADRRVDDPCPDCLSQLCYRFDWPRANFFTLRFFDPRA